MLHVFFEYLKNKQASTITRDDIEKYVTKLKTDGRKTGTQNEYIINIRLFVAWAVDKKIMPEDDYFHDIKLIKRDRDTSKQDYYTRDDIIAMLHHCACQRNRALLSLMWDCGGRVGEICNMDVKHFKKVDNHYIAPLRNDETIISSISVTDIVFDVYLGKWNYRAIPKVKTWSYFLTIPKRKDR